MVLGNPIAKGNTAEIYLTDDKVVKLFKDYLPDTESIKEAKKQKYAYSCGLPVPNVFEVIKIQNRQAIIMEHVKGDNIGDLLLNNLNEAERYIGLCVNEQKNLILSKEEKVKVIDWVDASSGDIRADVFRTYLLYSQSSVELAEMYLHIYCSRTGLSRDEVFQWAPIIIAARFSEKVSPQNEVYLKRLLNQYL
ncbi:aminoglycoside phosphotransferase [Bacillus cereus]|uniref:aminoglycoside phosphotransferase family protein n=1 Tax=Bacillus cereus group TaxID=86661 RepID=UPI001BA8CD06|nr:aminoglycoside phosphotransferase family protein [Bacillus cereus]MBR9672379.1 aminoglycoside phosphotransferase [Bacillus cereus]MCI3144985.1 aminoglycoside phosphotransferase [Bacillus cereus]